MSHVLTGLLVFCATFFLCAVLIGKVDDRRVATQLFERKGQIYMLVPAKLSPASLATKDP